ncbi:6-phosphogluconolactonase [Methylocystis bryophila]|uniref:6-phosphogluconolactonase n=1 Tax=Methylocystis bryophila TaxID=655015 RepID=A0A1W6N126_9HYPH|nr:6-phosphogluconolactonase [Methylocystis bryophila]ARN83481.1 6-phosphogluconolactonase [Methylocystis bryophila]
MTKPSQAELKILLDDETLAQSAAAWLTDLARSREGRLAIALAGGSTPKRTYELLAEPPFRDKFPWSRTHWFWGDERFVPHDDPRSNYLMAQKALLSRAPIPHVNIHPIPTVGLSPQAAAGAYEAELKSFYGAQELDPQRPIFDAMILGLGDNGHTASLMPGASALEEPRGWVVAVEGVASEARITLTYPALESSFETAFLIAGAGKRSALKRLRADDAGIPAGRLRAEGALRIFADVEAAGTVLG